MENNKILKPFSPIEVVEEGNIIRAAVVGRTYTFSGTPLFSSICSLGEELLAGPIRFSGEESGYPLAFDHSEQFIFSRSESELIVTQSFQSEEFIFNLNIHLYYDGCTWIDLTLMPRGKTVAQVFAMNAVKEHLYQLNRLTLEIPLKKSCLSLMHFFPNGNLYSDNGICKAQSGVSCSGLVPSGTCALPFRPIVFFGNEEKGLCFYAESDEHFQPADENRVLELTDEADCRILRVHLLDSHPKQWTPYQGRELMDSYSPFSYGFGIEATPVRPFPKNPYLHNALHIDCYKKITGEYKDFLANPVISGDSEIGYDRIQRLGVTTLFIHEKWNKMQNFPILSEPTANQLRTIIRECHKRGIKVIPYFGYEISSLSPLFAERAPEAMRLDANGKHEGGWWRVPPQRDYMVCYASSWADTFVNGIQQLITEYHFDGVYLDTTINPIACANPRHGCGYTDLEGHRHATWAIRAVRQMLQRLYNIIEPLGGIINYHSFACCNIPAMSFTHLGLNGESIQFDLIQGKSEGIPLDYLRAEYMGRNFGVPQEMLAYDNRPVWTYEQATAFALLHGLLTKPNDIGGFLEFISPIWKIMNQFPIERAQWVPYYDANALPSGRPEIKCSYYSYTDIAGQTQKLIFAVNTEPTEINSVALPFAAKMLYGTAVSNGSTLDFPKFSFAILFSQF